MAPFFVGWRTSDATSAPRPLLWESSLIASNPTESMTSGPPVANAAELGVVRAGEKAIVAGVSGSQSQAKHLADMGFVTGVRLEMVRTGAPCIVRLNGTCVGLGGAHQRAILVLRAGP